MTHRAWFSVVIMMALAPCLCAGDAQRRAPNVVVILADDLGYGEVGCFGQKKIQTPHLDRLAREGLRLTRMYAGNAVCAPSRCVLLTGLHPGHAQIRDNREAKQGEGQEPLAEGTLTLGSCLKQAGYVTGAFGKWGLGGPDSTGEPGRQGFDRFYGYLCQRLAHSYYPGHLWSDRTVVKLDNQPPVPGHAKLAEQADAADPKSYTRFVGSDYACDRIRDAALAFIDQNRERPFFLYYASPLPHLALQIPPDELALYLTLGWQDPPFDGRQRGLGYTPHHTPRAAYAAMISRLDREVGDLVARITALGLANDTILIFTSDNGATHLKAEVDVDFFASAGGLRGLKGELYEGGIRVPGIVWAPGRVQPGRISDHIVGFEDLLPTIADQVNAKLTNPHDGKTFAPLLRGEEQPPRSFLYREFAGYGGQQAVWFGPWKALRTQLRSGKITTRLFHLEQDPGETTDVAAKHPAQLAEAERLFIQEHVRSSTFPLPTVDAGPVQ